MPLCAGGHLGRDKKIEKYAAGCTGEGTCITDTFQLTTLN